MKNKKIFIIIIPILIIIALGILFLSNNNTHIDNMNYYLFLKGEQKMIIPINSSYTESGFIAMDQTSKDCSNLVQIDSNLDTTIEGTYYIKYILKDKVLVREIQVKDFGSANDFIINFLKETEEPTNNIINVNVSVEGTYYDHMINPSGEIIKDNTYNFTALENGIYTFSFYTENNDFIEKSITINNIDTEKPVGTCKAIAEKNKTTINVEATDNNEISKYIYNETESIEKSYTFNSQINNNKVIVYDKAGNFTELNCETEIKTYPYMELHFIRAKEGDDDIIMIRTENTTLFMDGGRWDNRTAGANYLKSAGVKTIDYMIGSHLDWDHVESQAYIIDNFNVKNTLYPTDIRTCVSNKTCKSKNIKYIKDKIVSTNTPVTVKKPGEVMQIGDFKLYFLGPHKVTTNANGSSFIFILEYLNNKFVFTGDMDSDKMKYSYVTKYLSNTGLTSLKADVLKIPHHGYNSIDERVFSEIRPIYTINANGVCKSTNSSIKSYVSKYGSQLYTNGANHNIVIISDGNKLSIRTNQDPSSYKDINLSIKTYYGIN